MPWKDQKTPMELKNEFVKMADKPNSNMSQLCRRYNISRKTSYKWLARYRQEGLQGLAERSRRPKSNPNKTPDRIEELIVEARKKDSWGGYKLHHHLINQAKAGQIEATPDQIPAASTITRVLDRHGMLADPDDASRRGSWKRFERDHPNELWQLDFKGEFRLANHQYCYPLTLIDDHSRFSLTVAGCADQKRQTVQGHLKQTFSRYGLPEAILCDNGPPWGAGLGWRDWGPYYTCLAVWLIRLGIEVLYCRPNHPQGKGKNERFNGTLKAELISREQLKDHEQAHARMTEWRNRYNTVRPHQALDMDTPVSRYQPSKASFPEELLPVDYQPGETIRKVNSQGRIRFQNQKFPVGKAFRGYPLKLRASSEPQQYDVYFCHQYIRSINVNKNVN